MNFSDWGNRGRPIEEIASEVQEGGMPPAQYKLMHPAARLTAAENQALIQGLGGK